MRSLNTVVHLSRRRFVQGLAVGGAVVGWGIPAALTSARQAAPVLRGTDFDLIIGEQAVNFTGIARTATTINGMLPAPILRWRAGETVTLRVTNRLPVTSSIHWHGIILPSAMDGVPGVSDGFRGIAPGETFTYRFPVHQSGTYWYHSHSAFQEQTGLYGAIVVEPRTPERYSFDRDYVVLFSDWTDEDPMAVYRKLKKSSGYYAANKRTHGTVVGEIRERGMAATWRDRAMWNEMRMSSRDLSDVTGMTYTFLTNGRPPAEGWTGLFQSGEKIRLRFINGSAMSFFDVRIPDLKMTVVAADGQDIEPLSVDEIRLGTAETYDVIVQPSGDRAYTIFAQDMARTGFARGTLTPDPALTAGIPALDPMADLSHDDMGMAHGGGHGGGHDGHHRHAHHRPPVANPSDFTSPPIVHPDTEYGPHVDMRAEAPRYRLADPGVGLRGNGRRVLVYADLRNLHTTRHVREPDREIELHLTGNMERYMWSIDGVKFADAEPLRWRLGERLRITLVNDTMMNHPIHLHGMWSDLESGDDDYLPAKHTVIVQPGARISYRVSVDAAGHWAYHCHLLYHMPGMFRTVVVERPAA